MKRTTSFHYVCLMVTAALVLVVGCTQGITLRSESETADASTVVLVATHDLGAGHLISERDVREVVVSSLDVLSEPVTLQEALGQITRTSIWKGEVLPRWTTMPPISLAPGENAIRIDLENVAGLDSWLVPGTRVGLVGTKGTGWDVYAQHLTNAGRLLWIAPSVRLNGPDTPQGSVAALISLPTADLGFGQTSPFQRVMEFGQEADASFHLLLGIPDTAPYPLPEPDSEGITVGQIFGPLISTRE